MRDRHAKWILLFVGALFFLPFGVYIWYELQTSLRTMETIRRANSDQSARGQTPERAFASLRASAKTGKCDAGIWSKAQWASMVTTDSADFAQPVDIGVKPSLCSALADEGWESSQLSAHGDNEMVGVWRRTYPYAGFSGVVVMYARRPTPEHPYEVTGWGAYAHLSGVLRARRGN